MIKDLLLLNNKIRNCFSCSLASTRNHSHPIHTNFLSPLVLAPGFTFSQYKRVPTKGTFPNFVLPPEAYEMSYHTLMVVGEAPGLEESKQGIPFVGPAGDLFDTMLTHAFHHKVEMHTGLVIYKTNVCLCHPPDNRTPSKEETQTCSPYLRSLMKIIRPKITVALGKTAIEALNEAEQVKVGEWVGRKTTSPWLDTQIYNMYHPAFLLHKRDDQGKIPQKLQEKYEEHLIQLLQDVEDLSQKYQESGLEEIR